MTQIHEAHLAAVAGCIEYLSAQPKCKIAAQKLLVVLRKEQLKLCKERVKTPPSLQKETPARFLRPIAEFVGVLCFFGFFLFGLPLLHLALTGEYMDFGG